MEKELIDQIFGNRQNYMMDINNIQQLNVASAGDGVVGGVQAEVVSGVAGEILGGKYDEHHEEHDVGDDDELKYVEEVQQSEKQQQQQLQTLKNIGLDDNGTYESNELAEKETSNNAVNEFGIGNGGFVFGGAHHNHEQQQKHDLFNMGNGHGTNGHAIGNDDFGTNVSAGFEEKLNMMESELDGFKNEGDFASLSNVAEPAESIVPQIDVKIETKAEQQEMLDEEEPSSLATNTTNGTSSLSENIPQQTNIDSQVNAVDDFTTYLEDKENSDPHLSQRPGDLDLEQAQSLLNPDAKEFVPSFGSNPASPTSPFPTGALQTEPVLSEIMETQMYFGQAPSVAPRHLLEDDDFVAQSPCKGKDDNNMDAVFVPVELSEFELEADKRPHEPEVIEEFMQRDEVMTPDQAIQQLPLDDIETQDQRIKAATDSTDFQPSSFLDHGPETCVDHETDVEMPQSPVLHTLQDDDDVMKRSMYVTSDDAIEDVLNSIQPIPTEIDSLNNSFIEESATESAANQLAGDKELLQVEEKEHVSHSPSIEEIQMNFQNNFNSSNKDISQLPIDMQEPLLMAEEQQEQTRQLEPEENDKLSTEKPFEMEDMLKDQQEPTTPAAIEKQTIFSEELKPNNYSETISEESQIKELENEIETQNIEDTCEDLEQYYQLLTEDRKDNEPNELIEDSLVATITSELTGTDNFYEQRMEINEPRSPFEITDDVPNTMALESLNNEMPENLQQADVLSSDNEPPTSQQQANFIDVDMPPSSLTANEKHLLEETKEHQLFSVSALEQQMSEMTFNDTNGDPSQAEEVTIATAKEEASKNLTNLDEAIDLDEHHQQHPEEHEQTEHLTLVDDSFNHHEQESLQAYQEEEKEQEMIAAVEMKSNLIEESPELPAAPQQQQQQEELESDIVAVEEPIMEAQQAATTFLTHEETELKTEAEEKPELPELCVVPKADSAEVLEPTMTINTETETVEKEVEQAEGDKTECVKEPELVEIKEAIVSEPMQQEVVAEQKQEPAAAVVAEEAAVVAAAAAVATTAVVAAKAAASPTAKKPITKPTATTKSKITPTTTAKKPAEAAKKPIGLAAKPRTVPAKPTGVTTEKKTTTTTATRKLTTTTTKAAAKTTTTTSTARTLTAAPKTTSAPKPTATPRTVPSSTLTARKPAATSASLAKPRPGSAPTKPTTLGLPATNGAPKTKPLSPRATLTTQVRKTNPVASSTASRTKPTQTTASGTAGTATKTFTARPAPKFTSSSSTTTTTATKRLTNAGSTTSTTTTLKTSSASLRKSTPTKPAAARTPTKTSTTPGGLKSKTPVTKPASPPAKPAPIRKPVDKTAVGAETNAAKQLNGVTEGQLNGDTQAVQQEQLNADSSIPMQTANLEQSFVETRNEQIPVDLVNA